MEDKIELEVEDKQKNDIMFFLDKDSGFWDYLASNYYELDNEILRQLVMEMAYVIVDKKLNSDLVKALKEYENWEEIQIPQF